MEGIDGATLLALMAAGMTDDEIAELSRANTPYVYVCQTRWKANNGRFYALFFSPFALGEGVAPPNSGVIEAKLILDHGRVPRGTLIEPEWRKR